MLNVKRDLVGKTITGVIAVPGAARGDSRGGSGQINEIWMLQFSDGSYVEFVSPSARRGLRRSARRASRPEPDRQCSNPQLALNVA